MLRTPIAFFDIDNTLYKGHSSFEFTRQNYSDGLLPFKTLTKLMFIGTQYKNGSLAYEDFMRAGLDAYAEGLRGKPYKQLLAAAETFYAQSDRFFPYVTPLFAELQKTYQIVLVTGETQFMAAGVAKRLGVNHVLSSEYEVHEGLFTGRVARYLAHREDKMAAIEGEFSANDREGSLAVGDSEGDIGMLELASKAYCIDPTPGLRKLAGERGWPLVTPSTIQSVLIT
jgi:putative phosphoserine phosphatase / 1-acylglycerol-3-phosphate O-acyltransferase